MPDPLPQSQWTIVRPPDDHPDDLWAIGADLAPGTLLQAYRQGLFPMPLDTSHIGWWSPAARAVIPVGVRPPRTVRRAARDYEIRIDTAFDAVVACCADPDRPGSWIDGAIMEAYSALHRLGWAHSVEAWDGDGLAGGLYGVTIGGLFAAESMFHHRTGASKAALSGLLELLRTAGDVDRRLLDAQWLTPHLSLVGAIEIPRPDYHRRLDSALQLRLPSAFESASDHARPRLS